MQLNSKISKSLLGQINLVHNNDNLCELWHKKMGHLHHKALLILWEIVTGLLDFSIDQ